MNTPQTVTIRIPAVAQVFRFRELLSSLGSLYCRAFHRSISRPVGGKYRCWKCLRDFELDW